MSKKSFSIYTEQLAEGLERALVDGLRSAMEEAFKTLLEHTKVDSGNAALHWQFGVKGFNRPGATNLGKLTDFRHRKGMPRIHPWVGHRRESQTNGGLAAAIRKNVLERELAGAIKAYIKGQKAPISYSFFTAVGEDEGYSYNADIKKAVIAATEAAQQQFDFQIAAGATRRYRRR